MIHDDYDILLNISYLYADADARSMTPSRNTRSYTLRSVPSSPRRSFLIVIVKAHQAEVELGDCVDFDPEENHPWNCVNQKDTDRLKVLCFILLIVQQNYFDNFEAINTAILSLACSCSIFLVNLLVMLREWILPKESQ